jgi:hypothetical protein
VSRRDGRVPDHRIPGDRVIVNHAVYQREYDRTVRKRVKHEAAHG